MNASGKIAAKLAASQRRVAEEAAQAREQALAVFWGQASGSGPEMGSEELASAIAPAYLDVDDLIEAAGQVEQFRKLEAEFGDAAHAKRSSESKAIVEEIAQQIVAAEAELAKLKRQRDGASNELWTYCRRRDERAKPEIRRLRVALAQAGYRGDLIDTAAVLQEIEDAKPDDAQPWMTRGKARRQREALERQSREHEARVEAARRIATAQRRPPIKDHNPYGGAQ